MSRTLTATAIANSERVVITIRDGATVVSAETIDPRSSTTIQRRLCKPHRVTEAKVREAVATPGVAVPCDDAGPTAPLVLYLRRREDTEATAVTFPLSDDVTFGDVVTAEALTLDDGTTWTPPDDCLIDWKGDERLGCLDVDVTRPIPAHVAASLASTCQPRPRWWHQSRSGGLHFYFPSADLAAVAAVWMRQQRGEYRVELKTVTRHPAQTGYPFHEQQGTEDVGPVLAWLRGESHAEDVATWLADNGLSPGRRYPHDRCVIEPIPTSGSDPVSVGDTGIYCYRCAGLGLQHGSRRPGFTPYATVCGTPLRSALQRCVRHFVHWTQAAVVVEQELGLTGEIAERCYRVLLKLWHGADDPRVANIDAARGLIRREGAWQYLDGTLFKIAFGRRILASLPATQDATGTPIGTVVDEFCQSVDLAPRGYPAVDVVRGAKIYGHHLPYPDARIATTRYIGPAEHRPRYRDAGSRLSLAECREVYERFFPGIDWPYLQLLIAARGIAESGAGMPPLLYVYGTSGGGKSQTVNVAAATVGDVNTDVTWSHDTQRFRQGVLDAIQHGAYCTVNEIKKSASRVRMPMELALEPVLTLTENSTSHALYVGPVKMGRLPVVVFTETDIDESLLDSAQLGRRVVLVQLKRRVRWDGGDTAKPAEFRAFGGDAGRYAADSLLSWIIDAHFQEPLTFATIAERLGFKLMEQTAADELGTEDRLREFFALCCAAPDAKAYHQQRWGGRGWKVVERSKCDGEGVHPFEELYLALSDSTSFTTSTRLRERDWCRVLELAGDVPVECQLRRISARHTGTVGVRFVRGAGTAALVNQEITR